jgi:hypothetical protein
MPLPADIQWSDLIWITERVAVVAIAVSLIGILILRRMAHHSIGSMIALVVLVCSFTTIVGVGLIAWRMMASASDRDDMLDLMAIGTLAGLAVALVVGRQLVKASRALSLAVKRVGDSGVYVPPQRALPTELAELSDGLASAHEKLASARARERALEASRRELGQP